MYILYTVYCMYEMALLVFFNLCAWSHFFRPYNGSPTNKLGLFIWCSSVYLLMWTWFLYFVFKPYFLVSFSDAWHPLWTHTKMAYYSLFKSSTRYKYLGHDRRCCIHPMYSSFHKITFYSRPRTELKFFKFIQKFSFLAFIKNNL